ncbi:RNA-binding domain-containing protein, partial [Deinococcus aquaticus]|uniref:AlbA family DNA-binding domain-containing protein n=1 Tax=Deinococcus aquaticus TaxID=328692 RepID=UPI003F459FD8
LFLEQGYRLLRDGGECGIVIPSGIYTDLGAKGLREMLFDKTEVTGLFCFENGSSNGVIFENVHRSFKFVVLSFCKGHSTQDFPAAFMRHDVKDLKNFPGVVGMTLNVDNVRRLSPDILSVMEFKSEFDVQIAEKMLRFPRLGDRVEGVVDMRMTTEFHMTNDSDLFNTKPSEEMLPMFEGKMIHQFNSQKAPPRYWINELDGRSRLLGAGVEDKGGELGYQRYRLAVRRIGRDTDTRTIISTILPRNTFASESFHLIDGEGTSLNQIVYLVAVFNSFTYDYVVRYRVQANISMFHLRQVSVPRLTLSDSAFQPIVTAAAKLICTTAEFDDLAKAAGLQGHTDGVTDDAGRAALRAELDARVAHLYGLSESEFTHILGAFPLVDQSVKDAALAEFRRLAPPEGDPALVALVQRGESGQLEFKSSLRAPVNGDAPSKELTATLEGVVLKEVVAFLNGEGGTLLIGVSDDGRGLGLEPDLASFSKEKERNADGFERHLRGLVGNALGHPTAAKLNVTFPALDGQVICRVDVPQGDEEAFLEVADKGGQKRHAFYIRVGNKVEELPAGPKQTGYIKKRWP